jgi:hypothetical protein
VIKMEIEILKIPEENKRLDLQEICKEILDKDCTIEKLDKYYIDTIENGNYNHKIISKFRSKLLNKNNLLNATNLTIDERVEHAIKDSPALDWNILTESYMNRTGMLKETIFRKIILEHTTKEPLIEEDVYRVQAIMYVEKDDEIHRTTLNLLQDSRSPLIKINIKPNELRNSNEIKNLENGDVNAYYIKTESKELFLKEIEVGIASEIQNIFYKNNPHIIRKRRLQIKKGTPQIIGKVNPTKQGNGSMYQ